MICSPVTDKRERGCLKCGRHLDGMAQRHAELLGRLSPRSSHQVDIQMLAISSPESGSSAPQHGATVGAGGLGRVSLGTSSVSSPSSLLGTPLNSTSVASVVRAWAHGNKEQEKLLEWAKVYERRKGMESVSTSPEKFRPLEQQCNTASPTRAASAGHQSNLIQGKAWDERLAVQDKGFLRTTSENDAARGFRPASVKPDLRHGWSVIAAADGARQVEATLEMSPRFFGLGRQSSDSLATSEPQEPDENAPGQLLCKSDDEAFY